ncbi:MAG: hypothetical protein E6I50_02860 [Chloroflexi bacterium]|nr:MAG: hypothetical protein E6I50_02860 [Chloroflexota bacterium]
MFVVVLEQPLRQPLLSNFEIRADNRSEPDVVRIGVRPRRVCPNFAERLFRLQSSQCPDELAGFSWIVATMAQDIGAMTAQPVPQVSDNALRSLRSNVQKGSERACAHDLIVVVDESEQ